MANGNSNFLLSLENFLLDDYNQKREKTEPVAKVDTIEFTEEVFETDPKHQYPKAEILDQTYEKNSLKLTVQLDELAGQDRDEDYHNEGEDVNATFSSEAKEEDIVDLEKFPDKKNRARFDNRKEATINKKDLVQEEQIDRLNGLEVVEKNPSDDFTNGKMKRIDDQLGQKMIQSGERRSREIAITDTDMAKTKRVENLSRQVSSLSKIKPER